MLFLPIVDRELRIAARRSRTYWERIIFATLAILICTIFFIEADASPQQAGEHIFIGLTIVSMVYCVFSGRLSTADCMSEEKREGTLGLLFLTDLKGYDVVLGKLVAASLGAFYGLIAILPVLAVPQLMGGISNGQFWRASLVLVNTFLFSLAIGILGSVSSRDARGALAANLLLCLGLFCLLPLCNLGVIYLATNKWTPEGLICSPLYALWMADDTRYRIASDYFWISVGIVHFISWVLLIAACWLAPRNWQEKPLARPARKTAAEFWRALSYGKIELLSAHRKALLDVNAFYWLAARARCKPKHVWSFVVLAILWLAWTAWTTSGRLAMDQMVGLTFILVVNFTLKCWLTVEACQQLAGDRKSGALELLFSTPLTERDVVRGQILALRRQFLRPTAVIVALEFILMGMVFNHFRDPDLETWAGCVFMLVADMITLSLVGMRCALTAKSPHQATGKAISMVLVLPWAVSAIVAAIISLWAVLFSPGGQMPGWFTFFRLGFAIGIAFDLLLGLAAWRALTRRVRQLAFPQFASSGPASMPAKAADAAPAAPKSLNSLSHAHSKRPRALKGICAVALIMSLALTWLSCRSTVPPVISVTLTNTNAPLRVFNVATRVALILPDGSLWAWGWRLSPKTSLSDVPQKISSNIKWKEISLGAYQPSQSAGLSTDGSIWDLTCPIQPSRLDPSNDWRSIALGVNHSVGLKTNGTLWVWGHNDSGQLGIYQHPPFDTKTQLGTNSDWAAIAVTGFVNMGVRSNGTLWIWGPYGTNKCLPELFSQETNWAGFHPGWRPWPVNRSGECWNMSPGRRATSVVPRAEDIGVLMFTNELPGRFAVAIGESLALYHVRQDGTLWKNPCTNTLTPPSQNWTRVGNRTNWVAVWGNHGAVGLTADGTIWTWGVDATRIQPVSFKQRLSACKLKLTSALKGRQPPDDPGPQPLVQLEPRPLMRMNVAPK